MWTRQSERKPYNPVTVEKKTQKKICMKKGTTPAQYAHVIQKSLDGIVATDLCNNVKDQRYDPLIDDGLDLFYVAGGNIGDHPSCFLLNAVFCVREQCAERWQRHLVDYILITHNATDILQSIRTLSFSYKKLNNRSTTLPPHQCPPLPPFHW